jgi:Carboxylesterase family
VRLNGKTLVIAAMLMSAATVAHAQVPPQIAKQLAAIGRGVCTQETAPLYLPLHSKPPYHGVSIARDISTGSDPKNVVDVFAPEQGGGSRPVLIYVPGGPGNKRLAVPNNDVFYDNIPLWAVKNGMVGVLMQRRPGSAWDDPAKDIAKVVQWVDQNVARYKGDPGRTFLWAQSAGNVPAATYVAHPEFYGPKGIGLKGVIFMSAPAFNILPVTPHQEVQRRRVNRSPAPPQRRHKHLRLDPHRRRRRMRPRNWLDRTCPVSSTQRCRS